MNYLIELYKPQFMTAFEICVAFSVSVFIVLILLQILRPIIYKCSKDDLYELATPIINVYSVIFFVILVISLLGAILLGYNLF